MVKCHFCGKLLSDGEGFLITVSEKTNKMSNYVIRATNPGFDPPHSAGYIHIFACTNSNCTQQLTNLFKKKGDKGHCYIATACYNDYNAPEVLVFREFRDKYLLKNAFGSSFVKIYYKYSPYLANKLKKHMLINRLVKMIILDKIYKLLKNKI